MRGGRYGEPLWCVCPSYSCGGEAEVEGGGFDLSSPILRSMLNLDPAALLGTAAAGEGAGRRQRLPANRGGGGTGAPRCRAGGSTAVRRGAVANGRGMATSGRRQQQGCCDTEDDGPDATLMGLDPSLLLAGNDPSAAAEVAAAAGADGAAAARREALFERLHRQRAEALLAAARASLARLKTRLRLNLRTLQVLQEEGVTKV